MLSSYGLQKPPRQLCNERHCAWCTLTRMKSNEGSRSSPFDLMAVSSWHRILLQEAN